MPSGGGAGDGGCGGDEALALLTGSFEAGGGGVSFAVRHACVAVGSSSWSLGSYEMSDGVARRSVSDWLAMLASQRAKLDSASGSGGGACSIMVGLA